MGKPLRVLIVEDSEDDALLLVFELRRGDYAPVFQRVETNQAMQKALKDESWDLVISDYVLPGFGGLEALRLVRKSGLDLPFIIVSGKIGEDTAVNAMREGANDYLIKGNISRLIPAIEREMQEAEVRRKRREAEAALVRSERRYKRLVAAVTDYIYTVTIKDGIAINTFHGPGCLPVTGYSSSDYLENPFLWYQMIYEEDRAAVTTLTNEICSGKDIPSLEHRIRHKDGSIRWVMNTIVPRHNEQGELTAYDGLITDITERKKAEQAMLENTSMLKEMEIAQQIQLSLLPPSPPALKGIDCAGRCLPATHIGGDYYDILPHGNRLDLVIADVSGHSVGAALIMVETRSVLRAQLKSLHGPCEVMAALNDLLYEDLTRAELFVTMTYLSLDRKSGRLRYANAGHPPSLLYRPASGYCAELDAEGLILGVQKGVHFDEPAVQVERGDLLLLYTDGVVEAEGNGGEAFGIVRLREVLAAQYREAAAEIIAAVLEEVRRFCGNSPFKDDMSLLLLKFL